jgi:uncharacterized protein YndB with AHSA1/START domain
MTEPAATRSIVVEREMPHPPDKIWRALSQAPLIEQWLMKNDFQPVAGHRFNFRATPMPHWKGGTRVRMEESGFRPEVLPGCRFVDGLERVAAGLG